MPSVRAEGRVLTGAAAARDAAALEVEFHDGRVTARVADGPVARTPAKAKRPAPHQGSLF